MALEDLDVIGGSTSDCIIVDEAPCENVSEVQDSQIKATLSDVLKRHRFDQGNYPVGNDMLFDMRFTKLLDANVHDVVNRIRSYDWISVYEASFVIAIVYDFTLAMSRSGINRSTLMGLVRQSKNIYSEKHSAWSQDNGRCTIRMTGISECETCAKSEVGVNVKSLISAILNTTEVMDRFPFAQIDNQIVDMMVGPVEPCSLEDDDIQDCMSVDDTCDDVDVVYVIALEIESASKILCACKRQSQADEYVQIVNRALSYLPCSVRAYCEQTVVY